MLLTLSTTRRPATDLGFLLHKHPDRAQQESLSFGTAHLFYPDAGDDRCTFALLLEVDPVALVRGRDGAGPLDQYVSDRPYVASSFLSVALSRTLGTALGGRCAHRPGLAASNLPLEARIVPLSCRGGADIVRRLFDPLGYEVGAEPLPLDPVHPEWGPGCLHAVTLRADCRLADLLTHLAVLVPVLDDAKHYYVGADEVDKLLRRGEGWLAGHPDRDLIARRYLRHQHGLAAAALLRLDAEEAPVRAGDGEDALEAPIRLNDLRLDAVAAELEACGAATVLDLGCGEGRLLRRLADQGRYASLVGVDASPVALERAGRRLGARTGVRLQQGALTYRDRRLAGFDAAAVVEVVEHIDPERLPAFEEAVFRTARPGTIVLTTPNRDYNGRFATLAAGTMRHPDHRFEWSRDEFHAWADGVCARFGYTVRLSPVGEPDPVLGPPTQMGVFTRCS
ncbi:3' terminal RNA ribose 2'-O-methyltransferase Hen1 (plasmid) [Skermanella rosea]|uniref:3' terminal RNA ribose 2'-O-methyltransferase Hen1 n=1 Tax=Skermanella rosea TaxID=1817965 RepID=UPI001934A120|nr:3' terminal RNA ribose 2'-O-methyltransferase Hen1 [Skermanella rosea]UEM07145.1 3' terminal RNA ribose 2'-O-methyltransferase Hen1 [Skermanella rosea]